MNQGKYVFSQLLDLVSRYEFDQCVCRYNGNFRVKKFNCWEQFLVMSFAQLSFRESLREIEYCLGSVQRKLYHCGIRSRIARSTLSKANENRSWKIYADYANELMRIAVPLYKGENKLAKDLNSIIYAFDSTTISLCLSLFPWATYSSRVAFVVGGTLVARRLDLVGRALTGDPVSLADRVGVDGPSVGGFAVSAAGPVAYRAGGNAARQLTWFDRTGKAVGVAGEPDVNTLRYPELSPDGRRVAMDRTVQGNIDVWLRDLARGGLTRLVFHGAADFMPMWSSDGMRIAFTSSRTGNNNLFIKPSNGSGAEERLVDSPYPKVPQDWSRDGRWLLHYEAHPTTGRDLWAVDMTSPDHTPRVIANTSAEEVLAQFSPDGRWVAYQTNESGRFEVVVQPFPDAGGKWQVSTAGGVSPRWRADGKELYFLAPDATMMAVPVTASGTSFEAGTPVALFPTRIVDGGTLSQSRPQYAVARDGRFLINQPVAEATAAPITMILNWQGGLPARDR